jgi:hypothetical protein
MLSELKTTEINRMTFTAVIKITFLYIVSPFNQTIILSIGLGMVVLNLCKAFPRYKIQPAQPEVNLYWLHIS